MEAFDVAFALARSIKSHGAVDLGEGRYAFYREPFEIRARQNGGTDPDSGWRVVTAKVMARRYGWTAEDEIAMPSWWAPERRFAIRKTDGSLLQSLRLDGSAATYCTREGAHRSTVYGDRFRVITVDYATGEEVSA